MPSQALCQTAPQRRVGHELVLYTILMFTEITTKYITSLILAGISCQYYQFWIYN